MTSPKNINHYRILCGVWCPKAYLYGGWSMLINVTSMQTAHSRWFMLNIAAIQSEHGSLCSYIQHLSKQCVVGGPHC